MVPVTSHQWIGLGGFCAWVFPLIKSGRASRIPVIPKNAPKQAAMGRTESSASCWPALAWRAPIHSDKGQPPMHRCILSSVPMWSLLIKLRRGFPVAKADKSWLKFWRTTSKLAPMITSNHSPKWLLWFKLRQLLQSFVWDLLVRLGRGDDRPSLVLQQSNPPLSLRHKFVKLQLKFGHCPNDFGPCSVWTWHPWAWFYVLMLKSFALYGDACKPKHSLQFSIHGCSGLQWVLWPQPRCLIRNMCISKPPKIKVSSDWLP